MIQVGRRLTAIREAICDDLKCHAATVFDGDQEVGAALLEVAKKPQFACSASACTNTPSSSTRSRSCRRAAISPPASVASLLWAMAPRPACWSRGSAGQCSRSRPEAITRCAGAVFSDRAPQCLAVTHQCVDGLSHARWAAIHCCSRASDPSTTS
jgi:hypothetical protein